MAGSLCCLSHSANLSWFIAWLFGGLQEADSQLSAPPVWNFWSRWKQNIKKFLKFGESINEREGSFPPLAYSGSCKQNFSLPFPFL